MTEDKLFATSSAKGIPAAWFKTLLDGANHILGVALFDSSGSSVNAYQGYIGDDIYAAQIARGNVAGAEILLSYGESVSVGALTKQPLFPVAIGATVNVPPPAGLQMSLVSDSANDDKDAGTGIRSVHIHYLDSVLDPQIEEVFLEGLTPVLTVATDIRFVQCTHIHTYGSGVVAAGNISVYNAALNYSYIQAGDKRCSSSFRRVPAGKRLMLKAMHAGCVSGTAAAKGIVRVVTTKVDDVDYTEDGLFIPVLSLPFQDGSVALPMDMPVPVESGVIVGMEYDVDKGAIVTGGYMGYFEDV